MTCFAYGSESEIQLRRDIFRANERRRLQVQVLNVQIHLAPLTLKIYELAVENQQIETADLLHAKVLGAKDPLNHDNVSRLKLVSNH